jgi:type IX secretion system PorP/SprF family membrane protein
MKNTLKISGIVLATMLFSHTLFAQLNPLGAQYFQNRYLANPAMAGIAEGARLNVGYRSQWNSIPGAPQNTSVTGDFRSGKVGVGINFYKDQAGLLNRSKFVASYAYHLPLNDEEKQIHFGLSLGFQRERLNTDAIVGSQNDQTAMNFNDRETIFDGDFGLAYTSNKLTIEGSLSNLKKQLTGEDQSTADYSTFYTAISYQFKIKDWNINPKLAYRGVRNYEDLVDIGAEIRTNNQQLGFTTLYHSNKSYTLGMGYKHKKQWQLVGLYTTTTRALQNYSNGSFELGLQLNLGKQPKEDVDLDKR